MTYNELMAVLTANKNNKYFNVKVTGDNTYVVKMRLTISQYGNPSKYVKGSKQFIRPLQDSEYHQWEYVRPIKQDSELVMVKKFLSKIVKYLNASGAWVDIKESCEKLLSLSDDELDRYIRLEYPEMNDFNKEHGIIRICDDILTSAKKGIAYIKYPAFDKERVKTMVEESINNKTELSLSWRNTYDNSIFCRVCNGRFVINYAEEYRGCGNGHYYVGLDATHAFFMEND